MLLDDGEQPVLEVRTATSETRKLEGDYDYVERRMLRAASAAALQAAAAQASGSVQQVLSQDFCQAWVWPSTRCRGSLAACNDLAAELICRWTFAGSQHAERRWQQRLGV